MIRLLTGNLGVDRLLHARAGAPAPAADATERAIERMAALGVGAIEEYLAWALIEPERDRFDWRSARATATYARSRGLRYVVYPWLHVLPEWFVGSAEFVPARCVEHDRTVAWPSPFAPTTLAAFRRFHARLADALGDVLDAVCVAFPADYGEVGSPTGFGAWASPPRPPHDHVHPGFWLGDPHARAAWERFAAEHGAPRDLAVAIAAPTARPLLARFSEEGNVRFVDAILADLRARFPALPLWIKLGHGGENAEYGIDVTRLVRAAARHGAGVRTTQATLPPLHQQRVATPCRWFGVPLASEPPLDAGRARAVARLFDDAAAGVVEVFDYPEQIVAARDLTERFGALRCGVAATTDVAVHFSRAALTSQCAVGFPPRLFALADALRDRADFALLDGPLIEAGALADCRLLALPDSVDEPPQVQDAVLRFVAGGGTLLIAPEATVAPGPLGAAIASAPIADDAVVLAGHAPASLQIAMGAPGESCWLAGEWHPPEDAAQFQQTLPRGVKARWSGARAALCVPRASGKATLLELEAWLHPRFAPQRAIVRVDGVEVGALERLGLQRFAAWLPPRGDALASTIEFEVETRVPARLGLGPDERALGLALIWVRLTGEGEPASRAVPIESAPPVASVDAALLRARSIPFGAGRIVRCAAPPFARFVGLFEHLVATATEWGAAAPRRVDGARVPQVLLARFAERWLAFNRGPVPAKLALPGRRMASVTVLPGLLATLDEAATDPTTAPTTELP